MHVPKWLKKLFRGESYWLSPYEEWGFRRGFAESMRWVADRIGPEDAFTKHGGLRFANRVGTGQVLYLPANELMRQQPHLERIAQEKRGVDLWYRVRDYKVRGWEER